MQGLFFRQLSALFWKNWIILSKHKLPNLLRCVLLPIGYGFFLSVAQSLLKRPGNYGVGTPTPILEFGAQFDGSLALIWVDGTNDTGNPSASAIMAHITSGFDDHQMNAIKQVSTSADIPSNCLQNFSLTSGCYAGVTFNYLPVSANDTTHINYTLSADVGLTHTDVYSHTSDFETRILPLQFAIDKALIGLRVGQWVQTPLEWPYVQETDTRLSYIRGIRSLLVLAYFVCYIGIAYQLSEAFTRDRADLLTSHMKAMGLLDSSRIISWHISISLAYLPAWITVAFIWHLKVFTKTNSGVVIAIHVLLGFSLASWSFFVATTFGKSPQLAAVFSTFLSILFAVLALVFSRAGTIAATIYILIFPPGYYIFAIRAICGFENHLMPTNLLKPDPDNHLILLPIVITCTVNIFLWPYLALLLESRLYDPTRSTGGFLAGLQRRKQEDPPHHSSGVAVSIKNLSKTFTPGIFRCRKEPVTAISDLSLDIPESGIFVLLGPNGAGKSTLLSIIGNLLGPSSGSVTFSGTMKCPPRGTLGIVPQRNVLFPDLTCYQTLRVWYAIKYSHAASEDEDFERLLRDCGLGKKIHSNANALSGGQKRMLQLAIGLVGGSRIVLIDECSSAVDSLFRHVLWRTITSMRHERAIVLATHSLDGAEFADHIAILAAPGKLVAEGSPVTLKTNFGRGYRILVRFVSSELARRDPVSTCSEVLDCVLEFAPHCTVSQLSPLKAAYHLKSKDSRIVEQILRLLKNNAWNHLISSVDVLGGSIEDIFLYLIPDTSEPPARALESTEKYTAESMSTSPVILGSSALKLADGRTRSSCSQAITIFYKRMLIARRSWLMPVSAVLVAVCGACIPLIFLSGRVPTCTVQPDEIIVPLSWPALNLAPSASILESPPNITGTLGLSSVSALTESVADNATFVSMIQQNYLDILFGGISVDLQTGESLVAWNAAAGWTSPTLLNLATNILYNTGLDSLGDSSGAPSFIIANYATFAPVADPRPAKLRWVSLFGVAMAVYPAFFSLYVSKERRSSIQAMQLSNGLSGLIGLWLGHLLWDSFFGVIIATIIIIIFATTSVQFYWLWLFWIILAEYGIVGTLLSYCASLFTSSPLTSFVIVAGYQTTVFVLYLAGNFLALTYTKVPQTGRIITIIHFTLSILSPIVSVAHSAIISVDLFSLLCERSTPMTVSYLGGIMQYGGSILYLSIHGFVLFGILILVDSGHIIPNRLFNMRKRVVLNQDLRSSKILQEDVTREARVVAHSNGPLRVIHVSKSFDGNKVVDDISFGVSENDIFALLGPNEGGKTTALNIIRGDVIPDSGTVGICGKSVIDSSRNARLALGVCPQFTALDTHLTVREHLLIYGRLRGLKPGPELNQNVESLMVATSLNVYADRLASRLLDSNQRKLSLAIALIGNPPVLLIDDLSSGFDPRAKREMWGLLRRIVVGKAIVISTHSAEEASALANKVGIMSKKMLAIGSTEELCARHATYQIHFSCPTRQDIVKAQVLMSHIPGVRLVDDVAVRFEVPIRERRHTAGLGDEIAAGEDGEVGISLAELFHFLASQGDFSEYTVERTTLEDVFCKLVRREVDESAPQPRRFMFRWIADCLGRGRGRSLDQTPGDEKSA